MARLFGTDGVRGVANSELTCELAFKLGQAGAAVLASNVRRPTILVGRDTRISGEMLESALVAGICSVGGRAVLLGVLPTPGIAYLTRFYEADAGVVLSASHNTVEYNGIKFFDRSGCKLPDAIEDRIEEIIQGQAPLPELPTGVSVGRPIKQVNAQRQYIEFLKGTTNVRFDGLNVVLDCAHGASSSVAPRALRELGAQVNAYYHEPDGTNINEYCGSTHPKRLQELVSELGADVGLAFDGDADRLIAVDDRGQIVDGDKIMAICALHLKKKGRLAKNTLVGTIMSNMGLDIAMKENKIELVKTRVGDRYVLEEMLANGYNLGGEQSGHVIFLDHNTTGDGIITAIQLLTVMTETKQSLSQLAKVMHVLPQSQLGAKVPDSRKEEYKEDAEVQAAIARLEQKYAGKGRVLIRPSGTEPLVRVMIEGPDQAQIDQDVYELAMMIQKKFG
ncbi:phosphoglucosamine mutase [Beduinella massiliensis]|uniref:phosphoglucosamine mutase n=1 Tax=Beduinella massiliensis TaxID=1852363 RepID=UPI000C84C4BB